MGEFNRKFHFVDFKCAILSPACSLSLLAFYFLIASDDECSSLLLALFPLSPLNVSSPII